MSTETAPQAMSRDFIQFYREMGPRAPPLAAWRILRGRGGGGAAGLPPLTAPPGPCTQENVVSITRVWPVTMLAGLDSASTGSQSANYIVQD